MTELRLYENVYLKATPLREILLDGWARGFHWSQTLREASCAGYSNCIVEDLVHKEWARLDREMQEKILND